MEFRLGAREEKILIMLDDIKSRKQWKKPVNELKNWCTALTRGVKWKALDDKNDKRTSKAQLYYELSIKILVRADNREVIKRQFTKQGGGLPVRW